MGFFGSIVDTGLVSNGSAGAMALVATVAGIPTPPENTGR